MNTDDLTESALRMTRWLLIPILIMSGIVTYDYRINPTGWYDPALFFLPLTVILTIFMIRRLPSDTSEHTQSVTWKSFTRLQIALTLLGVSCFVILAQVQGIAPMVLGFLFRMPHAHQLALFLLGVGLIIWGMTGGFLVSDGWRQFHRWAHEPDAKWLLLIIVFGLFVRVIALESAVHYYVDEANFASAVTRLRLNPNEQIMNNIGPIANFTWIYTYFQYYYTELFGATLANLRALSVIIGTLTIPAIYLLGRWAFNRQIGLLSAFLLAFYLPHIHYSRLAMNNIVDPLLGTLMIAFIWRGLQTGSRRMFAWAGVFLGLTSYFYEGGRLLYPALILSWLVIYGLIHRGSISKRGIAVFVATTVFIASAFYLALGVWGFQNITPRLLQQNVEEDFWTEFFVSTDVGGQILRYFDERINPAYLHIMGQAGGSSFYYSDTVGLVLPHMLPFMLIGLGVALYHWRRLGLILPLWIVFTVLGNSLIIWNNWTPRFVVVFPALILLIALGLDTVYRVVIAGWLKQPEVSQFFARNCVVLLIMMAGLQIGYYFGVMLPDYNLNTRLEIDDQDAARRAQSLSPDTVVYVLPVEDKHHADAEIMQAYERHETLVTIIEVSQFDFTTLDPTAPHPYAFFIQADDTGTLNQLQALFGERLTEPQWSPYHVPRSRQFALYQIAGG